MAFRPVSSEAERLHLPPELEKILPPPGTARRAKPKETYRPNRYLSATIDLDQAIQLARLMPDRGSAVLFLLRWQAARNEKMTRGPLAGKRVARLSGAQLAMMVGCHERGVRHALARLKRMGAIDAVPSGHGRTMCYRVGCDEPEPFDLGGADLADTDDLI